MRKRLDARNVKTLPAVADRRTDYRDAVQRGLALRVTPAGERTFVVEYSRAGAWKRYTIGPAVGWDLAKARAEARRVRALVDQGRDPVEDAKAAKAAALRAAGVETFGALAERCLADVGKRLRPATLKYYRWMLAGDLAPLADVPAVDPVAFKRAALVLLDKVANRSGFVANRCFELCRRVMSWAVAKDRTGAYEVNPFLRVEPPGGPEEARTLAFTDEQLRAIVAACAGTPLEDVAPFLLATGARAGEVMSAEWSEVDLASATWTIPAEHSKIKAPRPVPLSRFALSILARARERSEAAGPIFPGGAASGHQERRQKLIYAVRKRAGVADFALHGIRRSVRIGLSVLKVPHELAELCLGHLPAKLVRTYTPYPIYWQVDRQRGAFEAWGERVERILAGEATPATVLPFAGRA